MKRAYYVNFCCNDHRNGMPSGHVCSVHIGNGSDVLVELDADDMRGPVFRWEPRKDGESVRVGRRVLPVLGSHGTWTGNWCWDGVWISEAHTKALVRHLIDRGFQVVMEVEHSPRLLPDGVGFFCTPQEAAHG